MLSVEDGVIKLTRGDNADLALGITKKDGTPYDYAEDTVVFTVKRSTDTDEVLFQHTFETDSIEIVPEDTKDLPYGTYKYDVQVTTQAGKVYTVIEPNDFIVTKEVTF